MGVGNTQHSTLRAIFIGNQLGILLLLIYKINLYLRVVENVVQFLLVKCFVCFVGIFILGGTYLFKDALK